MPKICTKCKEVLPLTEFNKYSRSNDGLFYRCKNCEKARKRQHYHQGGYSESMRLKQPSRLTYNREYHHRNKNIIHERQRKWRSANTERIRDRLKRYYKENIQRNLSVKLRKRIKDALKYTRKSISTAELIGCSIEQLKTHIESQFVNGMNWNEYLLGRIHIDHKVPLAAFDLRDVNQQKIAFHWLNLQPLWRQDNLQKGKSISYTMNQLIIAIMEVSNS